MISPVAACPYSTYRSMSWSKPTLDRGRRRRRGRASFFGFFRRLRLNDDWRWGGGKVRPVTIITLMVMVVMMMMMVKMIFNLLLGVGEGIGSVGWDGGFFDGLGGAGGTLFLRSISILLANALTKEHHILWTWLREDSFENLRNL